MTATRASNWTVHGGLLFVSTRQRGLGGCPGDELAAGAGAASASERVARGRPLLDGHAAAPRHGVDELGGGFFERRFWSLNAWP
jgi:hypothetical protein